MNTKVFEQDHPVKAILKIGLPMVLGMLVMVIYNMADTMFVGWLQDPNIIAGVTVTLAIFMMIMAISSIFGIGGASYISRCLGAKRYNEVRSTSAFTVWALLVIGTILGIIGLIFINPLLTLCGASETTRQPAFEYLIVILIGSPAITLSFGLGQIARSEGAAKESMIGMVLGAVINIGLDPVCIFALNMGVMGAAIATVASNIISVLFFLWYFIFKSKNLTVNPKYLFRPAEAKLNPNIEGGVNKAMIKNVVFIGCPAAVSQGLYSISNVILNNFATSHGDDCLAAIGVVFKVNMFPVFIIMGICQGIQPLIGYCYGAGNRARMNSFIKTAIIISTGLGIIFTVGLFFVGKYAIMAFAPGQDAVIEKSIWYLNIIMLSVPVIGITFIFTTTFQSMGKAIPAMILSIARQGVVFIPVIIILNYTIGEYGIIMAQPIADVTCTILAIIFFIVINNKSKNDPHFNRPIEHKETDELNEFLNQDETKKLDDSSDSDNTEQTSNQAEPVITN